LFSRDGHIEGELATFPASLPADQYTASIDWGDGQTTPGTITIDADGTAHLSGAHDYADKGPHDVNFQVSGSDGSGGWNGVTAYPNADDLTLIDTCDSSVLVGDNTQDMYFGTFYDMDGSAPESAYSVNIDWGDGTSSLGSVMSDGMGGFEVLGTHTYTAEGT